MNEPLEKKVTGSGAGGSPVAPVGTTPTPGKPEQPPASVASQKPAPQFGGSGHSGNKFKFPVNTPEGQAERREAEAKRKRDARSVAAKLDQPPALLPVGASSPGQQQTPGDGVPPGQSNSTVAVSDAIPWTPELLKDISDELISAAEEGRQSSLATLAQEGGLTEKAVKKIHADAAYKPAAKRGLQLAVPKITARMMNKTGISSEHSDSLVLLASMMMIWKQGRSLKADVMELIEENRKTKTPPTPPTATA